MVDGYMKVDQVFERLISVDHLGAAEQFYCEILGWDMTRKHVGYHLAIDRFAHPNHLDFTKAGNVIPSLNLSR
jgi:extradiol dioxygenase family protein